ncbi:hypothetical protein OB919_01305 [Halobacteria archaeon AArc-curdl1]|uniref:Uncharacterized protein n=1 Tax=Natronosalvus hydrolyticus TaxID=2979988 RepID=A0AAP2Z4J9_9EURY|nr:hypothetical protein [Halobacteria archaeon AArc-curdl1]
MQDESVYSNGTLGAPASAGLEGEGVAHDGVSRVAFETALSLAEAVP